MYFGYRWLYLLAMAMYGLAFWGSLRVVQSGETSGGLDLATPEVAAE
jgi:hypothetical protein